MTRFSPLGDAAAWAPLSEGVPRAELLAKLRALRAVHGVTFAAQQVAVHFDPSLPPEPRALDACLLSLSKLAREPSPLSEPAAESPLPLSKPTAESPLPLSKPTAESPLPLSEPVGALQLLSSERGNSPRPSRSEPVGSACLELGGAAYLSHSSLASRSCVHVLRVRYDGEDLEVTAALLGLSPEALVSLHSRCDYEVLFLGFQPGFAYLGPLDERLRLPRRTHPRARVPAGSIAIAGPYTAVYPRVSAGGWHLLGNVLGGEFMAEASPWNPGDRVRFVPE